MTHASGLFTAAMIAGAISLDFNCFGPWMVSQPMVAGPLFGLLLGDVLTGVIIGAIVQLLWMDVTPVGVGIPYDGTAVALLAIYWAAAGVAPHSPSMLVLALALAVPFGYAFRWMDHVARRLNTVIARRIESASDERLSAALSLGIAAGLLWSWTRYTLFYALCLSLGQRVGLLSLRIPGIGWLEQGLSMAVYILPVAGLGVTLELFLSEEPEARFIHLRSPRREKS